MDDKNASSNADASTANERSSLTTVNYYRPISETVGIRKSRLKLITVFVGIIVVSTSAYPLMRLIQMFSLTRDMNLEQALFGCRVAGSALMLACLVYSTRGTAVRRWVVAAVLARTVLEAPWHLMWCYMVINEIINGSGLGNSRTYDCLWLLDHVGNLTMVLATTMICLFVYDAWADAYRNPPITAGSRFEESALA